MPHRLIVIALLLAATALGGCPSDMGFGGLAPDGEEGDEPNPDGDLPDDEEIDPALTDPYYCCDPDEPRCECPGFWICTAGVGGKVCRQSNPPLPDDGDDGPWSCEYRDDLIVCTGASEDHPDAGEEGDWTCTENAGEVECSREADRTDFPDDESDVGWDCSFSDGNEMRACTEIGEQSPDFGEWDCVTAADGRTRCRNENPETPDDGEWSCVQVDGRDVCEGDHFPEDGAGQGWDCQADGELVRCQNEEGQHPDEGGMGGWSCAWGENGGLTCLDNPDGGGDDVGGEGEGENPGDGGDNPGGEGEGEDEGELDCRCVAGARRYCDEPEYCLWGEQVCVERGGVRDWGDCNETDIPAGCEPGGAFARDYDWHYEGGFWDNWQTRLNDFDGDGVIRFAPDWWFNPAGEDCAIRRGECAQDMWDLDQDGDNQESLGDCEDIQACV